MAQSKVPALRLVLPGAPSTWHVVTGLPGHFHPDKPAPLGAVGQPSLEQAKTFIAAHKSELAQAKKGWEDLRQERLAAGEADFGPFQPPPCPVELTDVSEQEAEELRAELAGLHGEAAKAAYLAQQAGDGALPNVEAQAAAVAGGQEG